VNLTIDTERMSPVEMLVPLHSEVSLKCYSNTHKVLWWHNNELLSVTSKKLSFKDIKLADKGTYVCKGDYDTYESFYSRGTLKILGQFFKVPTNNL